MTSGGVTGGVTGAASGAIWGRAEQQDFRSRVRGTLLGAAIGDALGAPRRLDSPSTPIREAYGPEGLTDLASAYGRRGAITDDTQLTLFTVDGLIRAQVRRDTGAWHPPTDLHRAYRRWAATQRDWGPDERRKDDGWLAREEWLYARRAPGPRLPARPRRRDDGHPRRAQEPRESGLRRACPLRARSGCWSAGSRSWSSSWPSSAPRRPTATPRAIWRRARTPSIVHAPRARREPRRAPCSGPWPCWPPDPATSEIVRRPQAGAGRRTPGHAVRRPGRESLAEGWTAEGRCRSAVYCALVGEDVRHGLLLAVNHGGDLGCRRRPDGGLLGALHGETALPPAWLAELEGRPTMLELADDFAMEMTQGPALHGPAGSVPGLARPVSAGVSR